MSAPLAVLVVDDNEAGQFLVQSVLELQGFVVNIAGSSPEVHDRVRARRPDLILMDVQLPGQDGLALTRELKADPATALIPIVALTAHALAGQKEAAFAAGCVGYITKPIDTRKLGSQIREILSAPPAMPVRR
ncbi:MAG TPA: response regulator [Candidatus Baltobacterales bacterium]|nr:response regulator [Candidatus Baltobacterales bacterium]